MVIFLKLKKDQGLGTSTENVTANTYSYTTCRSARKISVPIISKCLRNIIIYQDQEQEQEKQTYYPYTHKDN
jgi:hypothetical protein